MKNNKKLLKLNPEWLLKEIEKSFDNKNFKIEESNIKGTGMSTYASFLARYYEMTGEPNKKA